MNKLRHSKVKPLPKFAQQLGASQVALMVKNPFKDAGDVRDVSSILGSGRDPHPVCGDKMLTSQGGWGVGVGEEFTSQGLKRPGSGLRPASPFNCCAKSLQSCLTLCNPVEPSRPLCPWDSPGKKTGVGCHVLLQGIFPT